MAAVSESKKYGDRASAAPHIVSNTEADWSEAVGSDLARERSRRVSLQEVSDLEPTSDVLSHPGRIALSTIRDNLDRRTREWRGSAKVVEQMLRQLATAEQARAAALGDLAQIEDEVNRTGRALTAALSSFDQADEDKDIEPLFLQSEAVLEDLDRVASELQIAQHWCRSAWKAYTEALERERILRIYIRSGEEDV